MKMLGAGRERLEKERERERVSFAAFLLYSSFFTEKTEKMQQFGEKKAKTDTSLHSILSDCSFEC